MRKYLIPALLLCVAAASAQTVSNTTYKAGGVEFTMVNVLGSNFTMGATEEQLQDCEPDEMPAHKVTMRGFAISQKEVNQELWMAVMGDNPSLFQGNTDLPVESVSYNDCQKFIAKLNSMTGKKFRLPTEAEWEYAARAVYKSDPYLYSGGNTVYNSMYCIDNSNMHTAPVSKTDYNNFHIQGMSGNVWEWCSDWYGPYSASVQKNPTGPSSGTERVCRGGGWGDPAWKMRVSARGSHTPDYKSSDLGFRIVLDTPDAAVYYKITNIDNGNGEYDDGYYSLLGVEIRSDKTILYRSWKTKFRNGGHLNKVGNTGYYLVDRSTGKKYNKTAEKDFDSNVPYGHTDFYSLEFEPIPKTATLIDLVNPRGTELGGIHLE